MAAPQHRLIVVTDATACRGPLAAHVRRALGGGPFSLLLRDKQLPWAERRRLGAALAPDLERAGAELIWSDPPEPVAAAHLSAAAAVPDPRPACLGRSLHAGDAIDARLDYCTYSPVWLTDSKPGHGPAIGLEGLAAAVATSPVPVYALGGVDGADRARAARQAGAAGVAVLGAVMRHDAPERVVAALRAALEPV